MEPVASEPSHLKVASMIKFEALKIEIAWSFDLMPKTFKGNKKFHVC